MIPPQVLRIYEFPLTILSHGFRVVKSFHRPCALTTEKEISTLLFRRNRIVQRLNVRSDHLSAYIFVNIVSFLAAFGLIFVFFRPEE